MTEPTQPSEEQATPTQEEHPTAVVPADFPIGRWRRVGALAHEIEHLAAEFLGLPKVAQDAERDRVGSVSDRMLADELDRRRADGTLPPAPEQAETGEAPSGPESAGTGQTVGDEPAGASGPETGAETVEEAGETQAGAEK